jgi:hypothetical protein
MFRPMAINVGILDANFLILFEPFHFWQLCKTNNGKIKECMPAVPQEEWAGRSSTDTLVQI